MTFKSFLRTLLHERCHHLDYAHCGLEETFHIEGFYQRESRLFHPLTPAAEPPQKSPSAVGVLTFFRGL